MSCLGVLNLLSFSWLRSSQHCPAGHLRPSVLFRSWVYCSPQRLSAQLSAAASPWRIPLHLPPGGAHASLTLLFPGVPLSRAPPSALFFLYSAFPSRIPFRSAPVEGAPRMRTGLFPPLHPSSPGLRHPQSTVVTSTPTPSLPVLPSPSSSPSQFGFPSPSPSGLCSSPTPRSGLSALHSKNRY